MLVLLVLSNGGMKAQTDTLFYYYFSDSISLDTISGKYAVEFIGTPDTTLFTNNSLTYHQITDKLYEVHSNLATLQTIGAGIFHANPVVANSSGTNIHMTNAIILQWKPTTTQTQKNAVVALHGLVEIESEQLYTKYSVTQPLTVSHAVFQSNYVNYCVPEFIYPIQKTQYIPNDEYFDKQFYLNNTGQIISNGQSGIADADIDAPEAWDITKGCSDIIVAVVDEGVSDNHPDLPSSRQLRLPGSNNFNSGFTIPPAFFDPDDPSPVPLFDYNHGNACAGIIAAEMDNFEGIAGVAPECVIMPVKITFGIPLISFSTPTDFANAITFAVNNGAHIINNSWGGEVADPTIETAIINAISQNVVVVFGAGNTANHTIGDSGNVYFPANSGITNLIVAGASGRFDMQANYSPDDPNFDIDIVAPSHTAYDSQISSETFNVWTIDTPQDPTGYNPWPFTFTTFPAFGEILPSTGTNFLSYTGRFGGTSAAAPQVAGVVALMLSVNPSLTVAQIESILQTTADQIGGYNYNWAPVTNPGHSQELGYGRLNAYDAVFEACDDCQPNNELILTTNTTWNTNDLDIYGDVIVSDGVTLTIDGITVNFMNETSMLIVEKDATLRVINGAVLQGNPCVPSPWQGVLAKGNGYEPQELPADMVHHGFVRLDDCTIRDAYVGVQLGLYHDLSQQIPSNGNKFGGGKLEANNALFINNSVGVSLNAYFETCFTTIGENCRFTIQDEFLGDEHHFPDIGYAGVVAMLRHGTSITGNTFENTTPIGTFPDEVGIDGDGAGRHGIGIVSMSSQMRVGSYNATLPNTFTRLAHGVDAYGQKSLLSSMHIIGNDFIDNKRGITLNANYMSEVIDNDFSVLKSGDYGVFAMVTQGVNIEQNEFFSDAPIVTGVNSPFGIVVRNTGKPGALINNNTFNGLDDACPEPAGACVFRYLAAVQVEGGDNPNVLVDCNGFNAASLYDLRVMDSQNFQDQGGCDEFDPDINPTANTWHSDVAGFNDAHISYDNTTMDDFRVTFMPGHEPNSLMVSSNVILEPICTVDPNACTTTGGGTGGGGGAGGGFSSRVANLQNGMANASTQAEYDAFYSELMRTYLGNNMYQAAKDETAARNDVTGDKTLVGTYVNERDLTAATNKLASIPQDTPENIAFFDFFSNYIAQLQSNEAPSTGNGKATPEHLANIHQLASPTDYLSTHTVYAQSSLASMYLHTYKRTPAGAESQQAFSNSELLTSNRALQITPNPANDMVNVAINNFVPNQSYQLSLYDNTGRLVASYELSQQNSSLNVMQLNKGIYIAQLSSPTAIIGNTKLLIMR